MNFHEKTPINSISPSSPFKRKYDTTGHSHHLVFSKKHNHNHRSSLSSSRESSSIVLWRSISAILTVFLLTLSVFTMTFLILFLVWFTKEARTEDPSCVVDNSQDLILYNNDNFHKVMHREIRELVLDNFVGREGFRKQVLFLQNEKKSDGMLGEIENSMESKNFIYVSGVFLQDCLILMDLSSRKTYLFVHEFTEHERIFRFPKANKLREYEVLYGVDEALWNNHENVTAKINEINPDIIYAEKNKTFDFPYKGVVDYEYLTDYIVSRRIIKTEKEMTLLQYATEITSEVIKKNMKQVKYVDYQYQISAAFEENVISCGCFDISFPTIAATGETIQILHYEKNDLPITHSSDLLLLNGGGSFHGYCADVTRTFPTNKNGKFNQKMKDIYNIVLDMMNSIVENIKPGKDINEVGTRIAKRKLLEGLQRIGIINDGVEMKKLLTSGIFDLFMPHQISHHLGLDIRGSSVIPGVLKEGMVISIEPGLYFMDYLLQRATDEQKKYLSLSNITYYKEVGGVRISDSFKVTNKDLVMLTYNLPRKIKDIEEITKIF